MKEYEDKCAIAVEKHTLDGANAISSMKDKSIYL